MPFLIPTNNVVLYSGIQITDGEQIVFSSALRQNQYFAAHKETEFLDCTYIRKTGYVRLEVPTRTAMNCNYMSFTNNGFENKTFYARIIDWKYVNNVTTDILYEIDWFQSKMFDEAGRVGFSVESCLVEREHITEKQWKDVDKDPYREDVPSLSTTEPLPMARSLERRYDDDDSGTYMRTIGYPTSDGNCVMIYVAGYDREDTTIDDFYSFFDVVVDASGKVVSNSSSYYGLKKGDRVEISIPNAYEIWIIDCKDRSSDDSEDAPPAEWRDRFKEFLDTFTKENATHSIIGMYLTPRAGVKAWLQNNVTSGANIVNISPYAQVVNKKLMRSPFQYIRATNTKGEIKEYSFEKFYVNMNTVSFRLAFVADPLPMISLIPLNYEFRTAGAGEDIAGNYNIDERFDYGYLPQVGYCIDSYLSYLSNQYMQQCATRTSWDEVNSVVNEIGGIASAAVGAGLGVASIATGNASLGGVSFDMVGSGITAALSEHENRDIRDALDKMRQGDNSKVDSIFGNAKKSFVSNEYHAGVTTTLFGTYFGPTHDKSVGTFVLTRVMPTDSILQMFDRFFSTYGYATNDIKVPNVYRVIEGAPSDDRVHFDTTVPGYETGRTYCKTREAHVRTDGGALANKYIENLFNSGTFFLNGDNLS